MVTNGILLHPSLSGMESIKDGRRQLQAHVRLHGPEKSARQGQLSVSVARSPVHRVCGVDALPWNSLLGLYPLLRALSPRAWHPPVDAMRIRELDSCRSAPPVLGAVRRIQSTTVWHEWLHAQWLEQSAHKRSHCL